MLFEDLKPVKQAGTSAIRMLIKRSCSWPSLLRNLTHDMFRHECFEISDMFRKDRSNVKINDRPGRVQYFEPQFAGIFKKLLPITTRHSPRRHLFTTINSCLIITTAQLTV